jgi:DNA (cytosine-5)-methyltransferase 1
MGFPDGFKIPVSDTQAYKQFGNSVVVPLIAELAAQIVKALNTPAENRSALPNLVGVQYELATA